MTLSINTKISDKQLQVEFQGDYTFPELIAMIEKIKLEADEGACDHALLDASLVRGRMTESEKFFAGTKIAETFGSKLKTAILVRPGDVTKMGEMAAVNRGARLFVTESKDEACAWLSNSPIQTIA